MTQLAFRVGFALLCFFFGSFAIANPLQIAVTPGQTQGSIEVSLSNTGPEAVSVLLWDTPFEKTLSDNVFIVESVVKGFPFLQVASYIGRSVKRSNPSIEHYQIIQPGETISTHLQLNNYYNITQLGEYRVRYSGDIRYEVVSAIQGRTRNTLTSINALNHAELVSESVPVSLAPAIKLRLRPPGYDSCSIQEQADIVEAATVAETLAKTALGDLQGLPDNQRDTSPRYNAWFGVYSDSRYTQVVSNFTAIAQALENELLQFSCDCTEAGIFAFVYPEFPYNITLCPGFGIAAVNGRDSRAGTIIHELSHFTVVGGTDDHVYGHDGARALAASNPDLAITNADSYEYFAENAPPVPLRLAGSNTSSTYPFLQLGVQSEGRIVEGGSLTYQVANATRIELTSISGDVDLYVYQDDQLTELICQSAAESTASDSCSIVLRGTVYAQVRGFTDATYSLLADRQGRANDDAIEPFLGVPLTNSVDASSQNIYQVSGGTLVDLESSRGDADLYVFNSLDLTADTLVCSSTATPDQTTLDRCVIPTTQSVYYVAVVGYTAAEYSLVVRNTTSESVIVANTGPKDDDSSNFTAGTGGGGRTGVFSMFLLLVFVGLRYRQRTR